MYIQVKVNISKKKIIFNSTGENISKFDLHDIYSGKWKHFVCCILNIAYILQCCQQKTADRN